MHLSHLQRHQSSHLNAREFECCHCGKAFVQKVHLNTHLKWTHHITEEEGPLSLSAEGKVPTASGFACELCNTSFRSLWHLNRHKNVSDSCVVGKNNLGDGVQ